jgi:hypothetical protein
METVERYYRRFAARGARHARDHRGGQMSADTEPPFPEQGTDSEKQAWSEQNRRFNVDSMEWMTDDDSQPILDVDVLRRAAKVVRALGHQDIAAVLERLGETLAEED